MRKFLTGSLLVASIGGGLVLAGPAFAGGIPNYCGSNPAGGNVTPDGSGYGQVCAGSVTVTAYGSAATQQGYVIVEGGNSAVTGYVGVSSVDSGVVGCANGATYDTSGGNNVIVPTPNPSDPGAYPATLQAAAGNLQNAGSSPCAPAAP
ncbi:MAG: hypothetical protein ACYDA2_02815 [Acidimicrobiales bacterium]